MTGFPDKSESVIVSPEKDERVKSGALKPGWGIEELTIVSDVKKIDENQIQDALMIISRIETRVQFLNSNLVI